MKFIPIGIYGRFPSAKGACSSYLLQNGNANILIDFGCGAAIELQKHLDLTKLDAIILTHMHYDHISDIFPFSYYLERNKKSVPLYMPADENGLITSKRFEKILNPSKIDIKGVKIDFIEVKHGRINSNMIKIYGNTKTLLLTSDFSDIDDYIRVVKGVDVVFGDACVFDSKPESPHVSIRQLAENTPEGAELYLTHLGDNEESAILDEALKYHADTRLASIGEEIIF